MCPTKRSYEEMNYSDIFRQFEDFAKLRSPIIEISDHEKRL